ncbi:MAG: phosphomannomutase/phosphoglucomutase [Clostridia bacterium]|nr:phosphomannomutase/phosphoglucomutase [Clostridia bacterium]
MKNYTELKSGSDVIGFASDVYENEINLTDEAVYDITAAFVLFLTEKYGKKATELTVSVGHDSRTTSERIKTKTIEAFCSSGVKVIDCGLASTPAMFMSIASLGCDAAVEITASEHPADRNGLKFLLPTGELDSSDVIGIICDANESKCCEKAEGSVEKRDFMSEYAAVLRDNICRELGVDNTVQPLKGLKIVVDASNGVGGFFAEKVLAPLGADTSAGINLESDGSFPNHAPNPENELAMACVSDAVLGSNADLGIVFDADADRVGIYDSDGVEIRSTRLMALASAIVLENNPDATVVTDGVVSSNLKDFIETLGGKHHSFKKGCKNLIKEANRLSSEGINVPLAIESSGHSAFKENGMLDDGTYLVTKIITKLATLKRDGKSIFDLTANLKMPNDKKEFRIGIYVDEFKIYGELVVEGLMRWCEANAATDGYAIDVDNCEGFKASVDDGWFLLNLSAHDPVLLLDIESDVKGGVKNVLNKIAPFFYNCRFLDCTAMAQYLETLEDNEA